MSSVNSVVPTLLAVLMTILPGSAVAAGPDRESNRVLIGVMEEFAFKPGSDCLRPQLRFGIQRSSGGWVGLPDGVDAQPTEFPEHDEKKYPEGGRRLRQMLPKSIDATVCFDGTVRGRVSGELPDLWGPRARGSYLFAKGQELPWVGGRHEEFTGWQRAPVHHPLVATTGSRCTDPDRWKPAPLDRKELEALVPQICGALDRAHELNWVCNADGFSLKKAYRSRSGERLLLVNHWDGEIWSVLHFSASGDMVFLGRNFTLIDAGDYDGDGKSELLFMREAGPMDGLVLYYESFRKHVEFTWTWAEGE
jgi:hypothetical protein